MGEEFRILTSFSSSISACASRFVARNVVYSQFILKQISFCLCKALRATARLGPRTGYRGLRAPEPRGKGAPAPCTPGAPGTLTQRVPGVGPDYVPSNPGFDVIMA